MTLLPEIRRKRISRTTCNLSIVSFIQVAGLICCFGMALVDQVNLLHQKTVEGNETAVRELLKDVEVDARLSVGGVTALYRAASAGHRTIMHVLALAGAEVDAHVTDRLMDLDGAPYDLLRYAIRSGDVKAVENILAIGGNLRSISANWRYTPLHDAVEKSRYNITRILLGHKVDVNADSANGTALSIAARQGNMEMILLLLENGADIDGAGSIKPPLIEAVAADKQDAALKLIELGAKVNVSTEGGDTAIHVAVKRGLNKITKRLIKKGLVNQKNEVGRTPLHLVQHLDTAHILLKGGAIVDAVSRTGETPLHYATYNNNYGLVELLVNNGGSLELLSNETYGMKEPFEEHKKLRLLYRTNQNHSEKSTIGLSALAIAIRLKHKMLINFLINKKSPLNVEGLDWPPLHMAASIGDVSTIRKLADSGAHVDIRDIIGWAPLHNAVQRGMVEAVDWLIRLGAQVDTMDLNGRTPLHLAAENGRVEITELLIGSGADAKLEDRTGFNALAWAVAGGYPYFLRLMDKAPNMESANRYGYLKASAGQDIQTIVDMTAEFKQFLHQYDEESLRDFLNKSIQDVHFNITDIRRRLKEYAEAIDRPFTFDGIQTIIGSTFQTGRKLHLEMIAVITNYTANLDAQDNVMGWSVLHWAAAVGDTDVVKFLVEKGAFINSESRLKQTPMFLARYWGHKDLYRHFKESGAVW